MALPQLLFDYRVSILLVLFVIVVRKLQKFFKWRKIGDDLPGPPASLLTGNALEIGHAGGMGPFLRNLHETYGPVVRYWLGPSELNVSINDPDIIDQLNIVNAERPSSFIEFMKEMFNDKSLFYLSGKEAKERRLLYHKVFAKRPYENIMPHFNRIIDELGSKWLSQRNGDKSVTIDFQVEAQALWAKLNEYNVFGNKCSSESNLTKTFSDLFELLLKIRFSFYPLIPYTKTWYKKYALLDRVHSEVDRLIREELEHRGETTTVKADLLSLLLEDEELDENTAHAEMMTLLFATFDNFTGLSFILHKFAELKNVQTKIRNEVQSVWGNDTPTKLDDLTRLVYTRAAIKEALRHGGSGNSNFRVLTQDYRIQNKYFIPKGAYAVVPVRLVHKHPNHWENPDKFDPERFMSFDDKEDLEESPKRSRMAYVPFGFGFRSCLGQRYSLNTLTLIMGLLIRRFDIDAVHKTDEITWKEALFSDQAVGGNWLTFTPRMAE